MEDKKNNQEELSNLTKELTNFGNKVAETIESLGETPTAKKLSQRLSQLLDDLKKDLLEIKKNPPQELKQRATEASKGAKEELIKGIQKVNVKLDEAINKIKNKDDNDS